MTYSIFRNSFQEVEEMMILEEQFLEGVFKPFVDKDDENDKPAKRQKIGKY